MAIDLPDSFQDVTPGTGPQGQRGNPELIDHSERLAEAFYPVGEHAWCLVGNGLSNQTFIRGPEGIIAIDTGECIEEMRAAIARLRTVNTDPIVACIYTHFHYVGGTTAILEDAGVESIPIYGHAGIEANLRRFGGEVAPRYVRGIVQQFGVAGPTTGEDGLINVGLGRFLRNPAHAPFSHGHIPADQTFDEAVSYEIAGLTVEMSPAPSDATDSITVWFPQLGVCVNNLVWPALFNVFAIRGEEYRDPRIILKGFDRLESLPIDHLIGTHGPPLSGREEIGVVIEDFADSIRYMWDQTVRGVNKGLNLDELTRFVQLPERFDRSYFTRQFYGLVEHHVKQIHAGLFGWFDEDASRLFPLAPADRAARLIAGFGGIEAVRGEVTTALRARDHRWAIELASWLVAAGEDDADRRLLATALRGVAQRTTSANARSWCLTRALELEGALDLARYRQHSFGYREVLASAPTAFIPVLRVLLDPERARGLAREIRWQFDTGETAGLKIRGQVAIPTDGRDADATLSLSHETWARVLSGRKLLRSAIDEGLAGISGSHEDVLEFFGAFDLPVE